MVWTEFTWLRIGISGGLLWTLRWNFAFHEILGNSWVAEGLLPPERCDTMRLFPQNQLTCFLQNTDATRSLRCGSRITIRRNSSFRGLDGMTTRVCSYIWKDTTKRVLRTNLLVINLGSWQLLVFMKVYRPYSVFIWISSLLLYSMWTNNNTHGLTKSMQQSSSEEINNPSAIKKIAHFYWTWMFSTVFRRFGHWSKFWAISV